jgi:uncharacterized protein
MTAARPLPDPTDGLDGPFWQSLAQHQLRAQKCSACRTLRLPAAPLCPACLQPGAEWVQIEDSGTLWSFVVYRRALATAFADDIPYAVGEVELEQGLHLLSRIDAPVDEIAIGDRMRARYYEAAPGIVLLSWVPEKS